MLKSRDRTYDSPCNGGKRDDHQSVGLSRHYSVQDKDSSKTKRVTFVKGGDALCQRKAKIYV